MEEITEEKKELTEAEQIQYAYDKYLIPQAKWTGFAYGIVIGLFIGIALVEFSMWFSNFFKI